MELSERERKIKERGIWEFRNLSAICISLFAIYMQMVPCMSDMKAMSRASFSAALPRLMPGSCVPHTRSTKGCR